MLEIYFSDTATWLRTAGYTADGEPNAPTSVDVSCRVRWAPRVVRGLAGEEVLTSGDLTMAQKPDARDKFIISGTTYAIARVDELRSFSRRAYKAYLR